MMKLLRKFSNEQIVVGLMFLVVTSILIYQHMSTHLWDFSSYVLNAEYLFYDGNYFETLRPPLPSILLGFFLLLGSLGEYVYIVFVSALFFYSTLKLSETLFENQKNKEILRVAFYFFSLSAFTIFFATLAGAELLSLALLELFIVSLIRGKVSGHYLALAFLSRYSMAIFVPFLFFNSDWKKILKNIGAFALVVFPWLLFNFLKFGNWFTSIIDAYANNIYLRDYIFTPLNFLDILTVMSWFSVFVFIGLGIVAVRLIKTKANFSKENLVYLLFILMALIVIWDYSNIPFKKVRFLFPLILPIAYFSTVAFDSILENLKKKNFVKFALVFILIGFLVNSSIALGMILNGDSKDEFRMAAEDIESLGLSNCSVVSPQWVLVTYFSGNVNALSDIGRSVREGEVVLIFKDHSSIDYDFEGRNFNEFPVIYETEDYIFIGRDNVTESCKEKYVFDETYVSNHCEIISNKFSKLGLKEKVFSFCNVINFS